MEQIKDQYLGPNLSLEEARLRSSAISPPALFADACRRELKALRDG